MQLRFTLFLFTMFLKSFLCKALATASQTKSLWNEVPMAGADKILGLVAQFRDDKSPDKINLGVGAYRNNTGAAIVLKSVREAETLIYKKHYDHEYADIAGLKSFIDLAVEFAYGANHPLVAEGRIAAVQSLSGTGALRLMGEFIAKFHGAGTKIYIPDPSWANHHAVFRSAGLTPLTYRYYNHAASALDFDNLMADLQAAEDGSFILLHACAHNPTGADPTVSQWGLISDLIKSKKHMVFFDSAYQGFASGNHDADAFAIRQFVQDGHKIMLAQSFSKNFGMYGERVGSLSIVTDSREESERVISQLKLLIRPMYSNPPLFGARVVSSVLGDADLKELWVRDVREMADRIAAMRLLLRSKLESLAASSTTATTTATTSVQPRSWSHITSQIGMFCFTGLTLEQVLRLRSQFHIYCTDDGRFSVAGINTNNVDYLANSMHAVITQSESDSDIKDRSEL